MTNTHTAAGLGDSAVVGGGVVPSRPMTLVELAGHLSRVGTDVDRWRLIAEVLEGYRHEPAEVRAQLLAAEPGSTGGPEVGCLPRRTRRTPGDP